jgi:hypothetical protein
VDRRDEREGRTADTNRSWVLLEEWAIVPTRTMLDNRGIEN